MATVDYDELVNIPLKSLIKFKQFSLANNEKKRLEYDISGILHAVIPPEEKLDIETLKEYYQGVEEKYLPQLSYNAFTRLVLDMGVDRFGKVKYVTIPLNKYYMIVGLQTVEYSEQQVVNPVIPNQILGFNSYDFGKKFKE